jgi:hypothetical protein
VGSLSLLALRLGSPLRNQFLGQYSLWREARKHAQAFVHLPAEAQEPHFTRRLNDEHQAFSGAQPEILSKRCWKD